jgi:ankyrin repeat protein
MTSLDPSILEEICDSIECGDVDRLLTVLRTYPIKSEHEELHEGTILGWVARNHTGELCEAILENGADPNHKNGEGQSPLHWAADTANVETLSVLLEAGADITVREKDDSTLFHALANHPQSSKAINSMTVLMEKGFSLIDGIDKDENTALHIAAIAMMFDTVKYLLSKGANRNIRNKLGKTPVDYVSNIHEENWIGLFNSRT